MSQVSPQVEPNWRAGRASAAPDPQAQPEYYDGLPWRRSLAYLIDLALIAVLFVGFWVIAALLGVLSFGLLWPLAAILAPLVPLAYHTWFMGGPRSATPGMRFMDIEVRTWDGLRPGYMQAALQTVLFYVSVGVTTWLILLVCFFNARRRCLHDWLVGTIFIRTSSTASP